jgi:hypothetical protein
MPELDPFETRLTAAVRSFAGRAETRVDAAAVAEQVVGSRRRSLGALGRVVPVPVSILLLLGLLLAMLAWSIGGGAPWSNRALVALPQPTASQSPAEAVSPTPAPTTNGQGAQHVTGSARLVLAKAPSRTMQAGVTRERGGISTITALMTDRRVSGTGTFTFNRDVYGTVATEWGALHLASDQGTWDGTCRGRSLVAGETATWACWLVGGGTYAGYSYYVEHRWTKQGAGQLEGLLYPGSPPKS